MGASKGGGRRFSETLLLLDVVWRVVLGLLIVVAALYVVGIVLGVALAAGARAVVAMLPVLVPAGVLAAVLWCVAPVFRRSEKTLGAAFGAMGARAAYAMFIALVIAASTEMIDSKAAWKWVTIGSFVVLVLLNVYERLDRWYSSKRAADGDDVPSGTATES